MWPFLLSQSVLPPLAGRIITLVVVPAVLVAIAAILWLLQMNEGESYTQLESLLAFLGYNTLESVSPPGTSCCIPRRLNVRSCQPPGEGAW